MFVIFDMQRLIDCYPKYRVAMGQTLSKVENLAWIADRSVRANGAAGYGELEKYEDARKIWMMTRR